MSETVDGFWSGCSPKSRSLLEGFRLRGRRLTAEQEEYLFETQGWETYCPVCHSSDQIVEGDLWSCRACGLRHGGKA